MKYLGDWVKDLVAQPIAYLNHRYADTDMVLGEDVALRDIEALPFFSPLRKRFRQVSDETLLELNHKVRNCPCEEPIWEAILWHIEHPLPTEVAHDLVDRKIAITLLGHTMQNEEIKWRLAPLVDEALLTLAKEFYMNPERSVEELQSVLRQYPDHQWMLSSLAHCYSSSIEKRAVFIEVVKQRPDADALLRILPVESMSPSKRRATCISIPIVHQLESLYGTRVPEEILAIASNPQTPYEILEELVQLRGVALSRRIRIAADQNLRRRNEDML